MSTETPYWDTAESMVGAGNGTDWGYQDPADWNISGFLAVTETPGAELFYRTEIPIARVAFKSHDLGGTVNILIDDILAHTLNTVSTVEGVSEIIEISIDLVAFAQQHSLTGVERVIRLVKVG